MVGFNRKPTYRSGCAVRTSYPVATETALASMLNSEGEDHEIMQAVEMVCLEKQLPFVVISVGEVHIGFLDIAFLPSKVLFHTTLLKNCGRGEGLRATTCRKTAVGGKQGHAPCKICLLQEILFFQQIFTEIT